MVKPDYQFFQLDDKGNITSTGERMEKKLKAIPLPDLNGKTVLDVGCDFGFWSFLSASRGAKVTALDRNREVRGEGYVDLISMNNDLAWKYHKDCTFIHTNVGKNWWDFGRHDYVYLFSLYHHIYENAGGDHNPIWFWLWNHTDKALIWENPTSPLDTVVKKNVSPEYQSNYNMTAILDAASQYFEPEFIGPAEHEEHRLVFYFYPRSKPLKCRDVTHVSGAGGATKAFLYRDGRRIQEIEEVTGIRPVPGSMNLVSERSINWWGRYYRAEVMDVKNRSLGLESEWGKRWARFYPVTFNGISAFAFRFEGETYPLNFFELVSHVRLTEHLQENNKLCQ